MEQTCCWIKRRRNIDGGYLVHEVQHFVGLWSIQVTFMQTSSSQSPNWIFYHACTHVESKCTWWPTKTEQSGYKTTLPLPMPRAASFNEILLNHPECSDMMSHLNYMKIRQAIMTPVTFRPWQKTWWGRMISSALIRLLGAISTPIVMALIWPQVANSDWRWPLSKGPGNLSYLVTRGTSLEMNVYRTSGLLQSVRLRRHGIEGTHKYY